MRFVLALALILFSFCFANAQNEQSPIIEKEISYKNWTLKDVRSDEDRELRKMVAGKKLTVVVYFAPWCGNWKHDAPFLEKFYEKYKDAGLEIIGVGEYDPVYSMRSNLDTLNITFPVVYESINRQQKADTGHYKYRKSTGDNRNWGSPWYIFLEPASLEKKGDLIVKKTHVINGEMIEPEGEKFIRERLGLPAETQKAVADNGKIEVCDPTKPAELKKP